MDNTQSRVGAPRGRVPSRLFEPQTLRGQVPRSSAWARLAAVLVACALAGLGAGLLLVRSSASPVVVTAHGQVRVAPPELPGSGLEPFRGAGAWVDVWDYAPAYQDPGEAPLVGPADVAAMAASGARTLYLQTAGVARTASPTEAPDLLGRFLAAAHARGVRVVGWYAPSLADPAEDLARLLAVARFAAAGERFDGLAVDAAVNTGNSEDRGRILALSRRLRADVGPHFPLALVVPPPAVLEQSGSPFPWRPLDRVYDVWIPRLFWTLLGPGRADPASLTRQNVTRLRELVGDPTAAVHPLGGLGSAVTPAQVRAFLRAAAETGAVGASIYDFRSTPAGTLSEVGTASAGGFGDRELRE